MFKSGDRVVCVSYKDEAYDLEDLSLYETYTISYMITTQGKKYNHCKLIEISGFFKEYNFISVKEYRKQKLSKLIEKYEI